jgi:hypothetical protein
MRLSSETAATSPFESSDLKTVRRFVIATGEESAGRLLSSISPLARSRQ